MANNLSTIDDEKRLADMELELLGSLLLKEGEVIPKIAAILNPDDFFVGVHRIIYQIILDLHQRGIAPNILFVMDEIKKFRDFKDNEKIFTLTVLELGRVAFTTAYSENYANTLKEKAVRRQLVTFGKKFLKDAEQADIDNNQLFSNAENVLRTISDKATPPKLITPTEYFSQRIVKDIEHTKLYANRKTGFSNIDEQQIFTPGLYVIGATPAAGKTTFCWQLLEQLADNGESCIFCSYEMSALELYTKTLARQLFIRDNSTTLTAADIRRGWKSDALESLRIDLASTKNLKGVNVFELRDESVDDLLRLIKPYCTDKDKSPVVCLDYLQILPPSNDKQLTSDKARVDDIVHKLKSFQRETNTTFIVVSSFNRQNYYQQVSFESFKESGNIEYTADVIWALQLNAANQIEDTSTKSDVRKLFDEAKKIQPRQIQLKCLKNRQGNNYDCLFNYYSAHDYFTPSDGSFLDPETGLEVVEVTEDNLPFENVDDLKD